MGIFNSLKLGLVLISVIQFSNASPEFDLPTAKIYQVDSNNKVLKPWTNIDKNTYETVIDKVDFLRLDCLANHPIQWLYLGNGIPALTSQNKYQRMNSNGEAVTEYQTTVFINPLKEHHTGRYVCSPTEYLDLRTYFYIYVPGQALFTSLSGRNIQIPKNDSTIIIPCTVSHPDVDVTLEKSVRDVLRKVKVISSDAVTYDPKEGFTLKLNKIEDPEGTYVCTAKYQSYVRGIEYTLKSRFDEFPADSPQNLNKCSKACGENAYCEVVDKKETCKCRTDFNGNPDLKCVIKCQAHTDCPSTMSCFVDRLCRNPCFHSQVGCGVGAKCRVENHRPVCYCPPDYIGDEMVQCFNTIQGSPPDSSSTRSSTPKPNQSQPGSKTTQKPSNANPTLPASGCKSNTECGTNEICMRTSTTTNIKRCLNPCLTRRCGKNAECKVEDRRTFCACMPGFFGDARIECGPEKLQADAPAVAEPLQKSPPKAQSFTLQNQNPRMSKRCTKPEECGLNSECKLSASGKQLCFCKEGFMGQTPKCTSQCKSNSDCPDNHVCLSDTRVPYPTCAKVCGQRICGANADCGEIDGQPECYCPDGLFGDPLVQCQKANAKLDKDCETDYDCGIKLRCETGADYRKCVDPCVRKTCAENLACMVEDHRAVCTCPLGYTGNQYVGCTRDVDFGNSSSAASALLSPSAVADCMKLTCGSNSECRIADGKPKCYCQSGFIGKAPACIHECFSNTDCPSDLTCIQKRCRHHCSGCGKNTKCRVSPSLDRSAICSCLDGFEGNANIECMPIKY